MLLRHLRPARPSASSPAPTRGRGQSWRYPGGSHARFSSGISPWSGPWWISPRGEGTGEGVFPLPAGGNSYVPLWQPPQVGYSYVPLRQPPQVGYSYVPLRQPPQVGYSYVPLRQPPPRPRCALLPRPRPGARAVMAIPGGKPCPVLSRDLPVQWAVVAIAPGGGADGEGGIIPPPLSPTPKLRNPRRPRLARAFGTPPPPPSRWRGQCGAIFGGQPCPVLLRDLPRAVDRGDIAMGGPGRGKPPSPGMQTPGPCEKNRYSALLRVPAIENRCIRAADRAKRRVTV